MVRSIAIVLGLKLVGVPNFIKIFKIFRPVVGTQKTRQIDKLKLNQKVNLTSPSGSCIHLRKVNSINVIIISINPISD